VNHEINSAAYWDWRFGSGDWALRRGHMQTRQFTKAQLPRLRLPHDFKGSLCDFGCGAGDAFPVYRAAWPHAQLFGVDISPAAIALCRERGGQLGEYCSGDVDAVPHCDVVVCSNVLEHLDDDRDVVRRLLEKCTTLFVIVPYREQHLIAEHRRAYDRRSFAAFAPRRSEVFACRGWSEYGRLLYLDIHLKNVPRLLLGRALRRRNRQLLVEIAGRGAGARGQ
jgi:2-polyprenyl-3-methyl-5-hydroxy-6-metoxy-1,4-benzoquinol methylase